MFIQYEANQIVNISRIERIQIFEKNIRFKLIGGDEWFRVDQTLKELFMNHLEHATNNPANVEHLYHKIKGGEK